MPQPKEQIVSAIVRARTELEEALYALEKMPDIRQSTVGFAAHALNNFLTVTGGTVELLQAALAEHPDRDVHTGLDALQNVTRLMAQSVCQLLNVSVAGEDQFHYEKVDLPVMVQRFVNFYQREAERKQIRFLSLSTVDVPAAWTDRMATAAVLENLFSNALKYTPPGRRVWAQVTAERDHVAVSVRDEGPGLSAEDQARLYRRGVTLTPRPTGGETSTGYGLAVAREFAERLGGAIACESAPGQGSCFTLRLPLYREEVHGPAPASRGHQAQPAEGGAPQGEDSPGGQPGAGPPAGPGA